jgi:D-arabinose 1-dehydrogenase-like Zn-dependent alcohol dehydrogenase
MARTRSVQINKANGSFELVERDVPEPGKRHVRVRVQACGICHSDSFTQMGAFPGIEYPRVPGHEIIGMIDAVGPDVPEWKVGTRVGVGWHGGHCGYCVRCRHGDFITCVRGQVPGIHYDGGYADHVIVPFEALAAVPPELNAMEAAPLMCAGITTYNALRHSGALAGDTVAILGIGGLGHLGVQYAAHMGFRTVAIARGADKEPLARKLGAHAYIDSTRVQVAAALRELGGARVVLATATDAKAMGDALDGLEVDGELLIVGASMDPIGVAPLALIPTRRSVRGWPSGTSMDSQETLQFSAMAGVRPMIETYPLERAAEGYERMMSGRARFRVVLTTGA